MLLYLTFLHFYTRDSLLSGPCLLCPELSEKGAFWVVFRAALAKRHPPCPQSQARAVTLSTILRVFYGCFTAVLRSFFR